MATAARVTVSTTPVRLDLAASADNVRGHTAIIRNTHATEDLILGGPAVATGTGYRLLALQTLTVNMGDPESLYGICVTGPITVDVLSVS